MTAFMSPADTQRPRRFVGVGVLLQSEAGVSGPAARPTRALKEREKRGDSARCVEGGGLALKVLRGPHGRTDWVGGVNDACIQYSTAVQ